MPKAFPDHADAQALDAAIEGFGVVRHIGSNLARVESIRASGSFDGAHLIPVSRYREVALRLEQHGWTAGTRISRRPDATRD